MLEKSNIKQKSAKTARGESKSGQETKRTTYSLSLPEEILSEVKRVADKEHVSILQVIRNFLKFGLAFYQMKEKDPDIKLIVRQGNTDQVILWF
jgi:hypothetical protein